MDTIRTRMGQRTVRNSQPEKPIQWTQEALLVCEERTSTFDGDKLVLVSIPESTPCNGQPTPHRFLEETKYICTVCGHMRRWGAKMEPRVMRKPKIVVIEQPQTSPVQTFVS